MTRNCHFEELPGLKTKSKHHKPIQLHVYLILHLLLLGHFKNIGKLLSSYDIEASREFQMTHHTFDFLSIQFLTMAVTCR